MPSNIIPRDEVARRFAIQRRVLVRYESRGLVHLLQEGEVEGYSPDELARLRTIVSLQRDLGVNLNGVEAILHLRAQVDDLYRHLREVAERFEIALDDSTGPASHG